MRPSTIPILLTFLLAGVPVEAAAQHATEDAGLLRVPVAEEGGDAIHRLRTRVRHTTVIVLPASGRRPRRLRPPSCGCWPSEGSD